MRYRVYDVPIPQLNWHIIYPTSQHDELPLYRQKENNITSNYHS